jgi:hypothetical protein
MYIKRCPKNWAFQNNYNQVCETKTTQVIYEKLPQKAGVQAGPGHGDPGRAGLGIKTKKTVLK